jgi:NTP pyrophosphatase (non-canonical NTP hydrolase)
MAVEDATTVGEGIREGNYEKIFDALAKTVCWTLSATDCFRERGLFDGLKVHDFRYRISSIEEMLWYKYPGICSSCCEAQCLCLVRDSKHPDRDALLSKARLNELRPFTHEDWIVMFDRIYRRPHAQRTLAEIGFHFLEECGEVLRVLRYLSDPSMDSLLVQRLTVNLAEEIADVVSWAYSIILKIRSLPAIPLKFMESGVHFESQKLTLSSVLWGIYGTPEGIRCPICHENPCSDGCNVLGAA